MDRYRFQHIRLLLILIGLLSLCSTNVAAQLPDQEQGAEPVAVRPRFAGKSAVADRSATVDKPVTADNPAVVAPVVKQAVTPPVYNDPFAALRSAKMIFVRSSSLLVRPPVIEEKLQSRKEFAQLGLIITRDYEEADLILIVQHDLFTKYVYTAMHKNTGIVVASGKLSSLGGTVAGKVAKRFLKQVVKARAMAPKTGS